MNKLLILLVVAICVITPIAGRKCYQCVYLEESTNGNSTQECDADPLPEHLLLLCGEDENEEWQCVKKSGIHINDDDEELTYVYRGCSPKGFENTCKESDSLDDESPLDIGVISKAEKCYCNEDGCNAASLLPISHGVTFTLCGMLLLRI